MCSLLYAFHTIFPYRIPGKHECVKSCGERTISALIDVLRRALPSLHVHFFQVVVYNVVVSLDSLVEISPREFSRGQAISTVADIFSRAASEPITLATPSEGINLTKISTVAIIFIQRCVCVRTCGMQRFLTSA